MATSALPAGFSITSISGKRCTAVPRTSGGNTFLNSTAAEATDIPAATTAAQVVITSDTPAAATAAAAATSSSSTSTSSQTSAAAVSPAVLLQSSEPTVSTTSQAEAVAAAATSTPQTTPAAVAAATTSTPPSESGSSDSNTETSVQTSQSSNTSTLAPASAVDAATPSSSIDDGESTASSAPTSAQPVVQSEITPNPTSTTNGADQSAFIPAATSSILGSAASQVSDQPASSPTPSGSASTPTTSMGAVVGGVVGGLAFLGFVGILLWWFTRKRRNSRYFSPDNDTSEKTYYEIDAQSVGPTNPFVKFTAQASSRLEQLMASIMEKASDLKEKANGRSDSPSINMDRGNSQFLEPLPQLSRRTTSLAGGIRGVTTLDRFKDWWGRVTADVNFNWRILQKEKESTDPFTFARERATGDTRTRGTSLPRSTDFTEFLALKDSELRQSNDRRRSQSLGSLGIDFSSISRDPFADPARGPAPNGSKVPTLDPFADPTITEPKSARTKISPERTSGNYVNDVRRSRGQSVDRNIGTSQNPPRSVAAQSMASNADNNNTSNGGERGRYPSTIRFSKDSRDTMYRDTMYSSFSAGRKGKGRSDPFDLERPEFRHAAAKAQASANAAKSRQSATLSDVEESKSIESDLRREDENMAARFPNNAMSGGMGPNGMQPRIVSVASGRGRVVSDATYSSIYSSGTASAMFSDWGDPGPDLGPVAGRQQQQQAISPTGTAMSGESNKTNGVGKAL